jgi:hypothetical protein
MADSGKESCLMIKKNRVLRIGPFLRKQESKLLLLCPEANVKNKISCSL